MQFEILKNYEKTENYLKEILNISKKNLHLIRMKKDSILINEKIENLNTKLNKNDILKINIELQKSNYISNSSLKIIKEYEDDYLLIVSKPNFMKTHPNDVEKEQDTLINFLIADYSYLEPIHRLDKDTCGLVIFAKSPLIKSKLDDMLNNKDIIRHYSAVVKNNISKQTITTNIGRDIKEKNKMAVTKKGKLAITNILNCEKIKNNLYKVDIVLETGRTHQIRTHLAYKNSPIIGDKLYNKNTTEDIMYLGAFKIIFTHPIFNKKIEIKSSLEKNFLKQLDK